jgi:hypothetical protein
MLHAATPGSPVTPSVLDTLMARWSAPPDAAQAPPMALVDPERIVQARSVLVQTLERYTQYLSADDRALYGRLLGTRSPQDWQRQFFECFDLVARTRGIAIAVLRMHELYGVLHGSDRHEAPAPLQHAPA